MQALVLGWVRARGEQLAREMEDRADVVGHGRNRLCVGQVAADDLRTEPRKIVRGVRRAHERPHRAALGTECGNQVASDESAGTSDQDGGFG